MFGKLKHIMKSEFARQNRNEISAVARELQFEALLCFILMRQTIRHQIVQVITKLTSVHGQSKNKNGQNESDVRGL